MGFIALNFKHKNKEIIPPTIQIPFPYTSQICSTILVPTPRTRYWFNSKGTESAHGRVGRVTDCGVRGLGFKSPGSILTSRTEISFLSRVVRDGRDTCSIPLSGEKNLMR